MTFRNTVARSIDCFVEMNRLYALDMDDSERQQKIAEMSTALDEASIEPEHYIQDIPVIESKADQVRRAIIDRYGWDSPQLAVFQNGLRRQLEIHGGYTEPRDLDEPMDQKERLEEFMASAARLMADLMQIREDCRRKQAESQGKSREELEAEGLELENELKRQEIEAAKAATARISGERTG